MRQYARHPDCRRAGQLPVDTKRGSSKYLNNLIEQDHRGVKLRIGPVVQDRSGHDCRH